MGLFGNSKKKKDTEFHKYADQLIGNNDEPQSTSADNRMPVEHLDRAQQEDILNSYAKSQREQDNTPAPADDESQSTSDQAQMHDIIDGTEEVDYSSDAGADGQTGSANVSGTVSANSDTTTADSYQQEEPEQSTPAPEETGYEEPDYGSQNTADEPSYDNADKYELTPDKLATVNNVIESNYVFDVDAAFVDWFTNDLPVTAGENGLDSLRNRKVIAMHSLTKTYLKILLALDGSQDGKPKRFEDLTADDIDKLKLSKGGFLTIYSSYIFNNIDYLLTAIHFYNGNINEVEKSNWNEINTSDYLQKLYSIAIHGSEYVHAHNNDYENAIVRMSKGVKNGNIRLDRD